MAQGLSMRADGLSKAYGRRPVVEEVSFQVPREAVTGFLGPNGAGKTTTMRMLTGLSLPDEGAALLDGRPVRQVANLGRHLGLLLDSSAMHSGRTVRETMRIVTQTMGVPLSRGDALLEEVGLGTVRGRRAGALSMGMRQRLGIAVALAGSPDYLVLDEPMNGLDTEGIGWLKELLREFAAAGGGVLLSTHLIGEIQDLADHVVVINRGRVVAEARPGELGDSERLVRSSDDTALLAALGSVGFAARVEGQAILTEASLERVGQVAFEAGVPLVELREARRDLAKYVRQHTDGEFAARAGSANERSEHSHEGAAA